MWMARTKLLLTTPYQISIPKMVSSQPQIHPLRVLLYVSLELWTFKRLPTKFVFKDTAGEDGLLYEAPNPSGSSNFECGNAVC